MGYRISLIVILMLQIMSSAQASDEALKQTVNDLRKQVKMLTSRLQQLEQRLNHEENSSVQSTSELQIENKKVEVGDPKGLLKFRVQTPHWQ